MTAELKNETSSNKPLGIWESVATSYSLYSSNLNIIVFLVLFLGIIDCLFAFMTINHFTMIEQATDQGLDIPVITIASVMTSVVLYVLIYALLVIGIQRVFVTKMRGEQATLSTFFSAFNRAGAILIGMILLYFALFFVLAILGTLYAAASLLNFTILTILATVGILVLAFLIYLRFVAYSFFGLLLLDNHDMGPINALKTAREKMWNHVANIILAVLVAGLTLLPVAILVSVLVAFLGGGGTTITAVDVIAYFIYEAMAILPMILLAVFYHRVMEK